MEANQPHVSDCELIPPSRQVPSLREDVLAGLFSDPKTLPPKYFYDDRGSALFDQICQQPEYYPTRTEDALLSDCAADIIDLARPEQILEIGSGTSRKTRRLLDACAARGYFAVYSPFDVCEEILVKTAAELTSVYPWLDVQPLVGDYTAGLDNIPIHEGRNLIVFLGGTIGNFSEKQAIAFLTELRSLMGSEDSLLIGADRVKPPEVLHAAYNDKAGVTAAFNLNLLNVLNRELGANFNLRQFEHHACYNPEKSQIEMYLISAQAQNIAFKSMERCLVLDEGDAICTEISRKFTREALEALLTKSGFKIHRHFEAAVTKFSLILAESD